METREAGPIRHRLVRFAKRIVGILLGLILLIGGLVPIGVLGGLVLSIGAPDGLPWWGIVAVVIFAAGLATAAFTLGWRLVSDRERAGGGLVHPWLLYGAGVVLTWVGMSRQMMFGAPWGQATLDAGAEALRLAKSRRAAHSRSRRR